MSKPITVQLSSYFCGTEEFDFPTLQKALEGVKRLYLSSKRFAKEDGIDREIIIKIRGAK